MAVVDNTTYSGRFSEAWKEALIIGGIAALAVAIGVERIIAETAASTGILRALGPQLAPPLIVGGTVFAADMFYDLFIRNYDKK